MAISFVGSLPAVGANNGGNVTLTFSNLRDTADAAVTLLEGDLVVCAYACSGTADHAMSTSSVGWTEISPEVFADGTIDTNLAVYYKVMGASPDTSFVAVGPTGNSNATIATAFAFRGAHGTTPFSIAATTATGTGTSVPNPASITPTTAGSWPICVGAGVAGTGAAFTVPASLSSTTNHFRSANHAETNDAAIGMGIKTDWSSGAFDCATFGGGNVNASNSWGAISLVLEPASLTLTNVAGSSSPAFSASGALSGTGALAGSSSPAFTAAGALAGLGGISGASSMAFALSGALTGLGSLAGAVSMAFTLAATPEGGEVPSSFTPRFIRPFMTNFAV